MLLSRAIIDLHPLLYIQESADLFPFKCLKDEVMLGLHFCCGNS